MKRLIFIILLLAAPVAAQDRLLPDCTYSEQEDGNSTCSEWTTRFSEKLLAAQEDNSTWNGCLDMSSGCLKADGNCTCLEWTKWHDNLALQFVGIDPAEPEETKIVGTLKMTNGILRFEGDMDQSAELFLEFVNERAPEFCERVRERE